MEFNFVLDGAYRWVAGQEIIDGWDYQHWIDALDRQEGTTTRLLGHSVEGRPLYLAETADRPEFVLFIGRQHPPEVTGAVGMKAFLGTVFSDSDLAVRIHVEHYNPALRLYERLGFTHVDDHGVHKLMEWSPAPR